MNIIPCHCNEQCFFYNDISNEVMVFKCGKEENQCDFIEQYEYTFDSDSESESEPEQDSIQHSIQDDAKLEFDSLEGNYIQHMKQLDLKQVKTFTKQTFANIYDRLQHKKYKYSHLIKPPDTIFNHEDYVYFIAKN
jgi:hypothetical protein